MGGSYINRELERLDVHRRGWWVESLDETLSLVESFLEGFCLSVITVWFLSIGIHAAFLVKF